MNKELKEALDVLEDVINQACRVESDDDPEGYYLDSVAISAYARGIKFLEKHKRVKIKSGFGRMVIAKFIKKTVLRELLIKEKEEEDE